EPLPLLGHRPPGEDTDTTRDHPGGHPHGMGVDGEVADGRAHRQFTPASMRAWVAARTTASVPGARACRCDRQAPHRLPLMSWPCLMVCRNPVFLSQRSTECSRR